MLFLLPCLALVGAVAACGNNAAKQESMNKDKTVELTVWEGSRNKDAFDEQQEKEFLKQHPNIKLKKVVKEGDPGNEFYQAVAAGTAPDFVESSFTVANQLASAGVVEPLDDYMKNWDESKQFDEKYLTTLKKNGKLYALPTEVNPMLFGYNKALFKEKGIEKAPENWEQALEAAKKINNPDKQVAGYATLTSEWTEWFFQYYVWQAGGDLTQKNDDGTIKLTFTDPAVLKAANYYQELVKNNVLPSDRTLKFDDLLGQFSQGKIGMMPFATDWVMDVVNKGMDLDDLGLTIAPSGPSGKAPTAIGGKAYVINAKSSKEKKDAAWEYIKFFASKAQRSAYYKNQASKGALAPVVIPRTDMKISEFGEFPAEFQEVLNKVANDSRLEFYGKADFGTYVDRAVQKIILNPNADPEKEFSEAQKLAEKEEVKNFNEKVK